MSKISKLIHPPKHVNMREERQHKETQSRVIQSAKKVPQGAYIVDNRNTSQMKLMDAIQRSTENKTPFVDNRDTPQTRLMKAIQRMGMEDEELQMKPITQLQSEDEELQMKPVAQLQSEDEELQMKPIVQLQSEDDELLQGKFETIQQKPNNTGLPDNLKSGVESMSGFSMDDVRVHYNSDKPAQMQAHAYAQGTDIHVAPGQEKHLPHEAWHVVQQKQGRVQPTMQMQGVGVNNDSSLESEADVMGSYSLSNIAISSQFFAKTAPSSTSVVQLMKLTELLFTRFQSEVNKLTIAEVEDIMIKPSIKSNNIDVIITDIYERILAIRPSFFTGDPEADDILILKGCIFTKISKLVGNDGITKTIGKGRSKKTYTINKDTFSTAITEGDKWTQHAWVGGKDSSGNTTGIHAGPCAKNPRNIEGLDYKYSSEVQAEGASPKALLPTQGVDDQKYASSLFPETITRAMLNSMLTFFSHKKGNFSLKETNNYTVRLTKEGDTAYPKIEKKSKK